LIFHGNHTTLNQRVQDSIGGPGGGIALPSCRPLANRLPSRRLSKAWRRRRGRAAICAAPTRGPLRVDITHRLVFVWDGVEGLPRCWHLIVRREVGSPTTLNYSLSNAAPDTPTLRLAQMQGHRYWVERIFEDAKGGGRPLAPGTTHTIPH
jgi:hypothetical protein